MHDTDSVTQAYRLAVAPMLDRTNRHCRTLHRGYAPHALLFSEMIVADALVRGQRPDLLHHGEHPAPVACQLGGSDPVLLAEASDLATRAAYDEVNLNVGCPSNRVRSGRFGACLMADPSLVARCVGAMKAATDLPITVKCRLGIDDLDTQRHLVGFVDMLVDAGVDRLYLHARKAILTGLSPSQNRIVPPLQPERVYDIKVRFPTLAVIINGGIDSIESARAHLDHVDGVMIGRAAYRDPAFINALHGHIFGWSSDTGDALASWLAYLQRQLEGGTPLRTMTRHMLGLFNGQPGAKRYRRMLSDANRLRDNDIQLVHDALAGITSPRTFPRAA